MTMIDPQQSAPDLCRLDWLFRLLAGQWVPHIVWVLGTHGGTRFGALQRLVPGISSKVLTERLRFLENEGILDRHQEPTVPPRVTYSLTTKGERLHNSIKAIETSVEVSPLKSDESHGAQSADLSDQSAM